MSSRTSLSVLKVYGGVGGWSNDNRVSKVLRLKTLDFRLDFDFGLGLSLDNFHFPLISLIMLCA